MIPRLAPRRSQRRSMASLNDDQQSAAAIFSDEDLPDAPYTIKPPAQQPLPPPPPMMEAPLSSTSYTSSDGAAPQSPKPQPGVLLAWASSSRPALFANRTATTSTSRNAQPSQPSSLPPMISSPIPSLFKSPSSSESCCSSDFSLETPPAPGPRCPLGVSAKRLGQDVRRKHSKRRRRRRRSHHQALTSSNNTNNNNNTNQAVLGLWNDNNLQTTCDSSDDSDLEQQQLPFLFASSSSSQSHSSTTTPSSLLLLSNQERKKQYWEWCYGKTTMEWIPPPSWSANRAPPSRSWYVLVFACFSIPLVRCLLLYYPRLTLILPFLFYIFLSLSLSLMA
jgi:hypothetical protein